MINCVNKINCTSELYDNDDDLIKIASLILVNTHTNKKEKKYLAKKKLTRE